ncbi:hypothetical protein R1flu_002353 [Riccia fluitans]|uniref:RHOMBOID-like protein n=1 Tax=Riccia fluitans TaxID=41844 RepID=A0ABD1Y5V0_9MARC
MGASGKHETDIEHNGSARRSSSGKNYVYPSSMGAPGPIPMPIEDRRHRVFLIPLFVTANIVVFIVTMWRNNCPDHIRIGGKCVLRWLGRFSFQPWSENPLLGPSALTLLNMGGLERNHVIHQDEGWRLISCMWLHAGVFHLLANMIGLLIIGLRLEREFGFIRVGIVYLLSGFGGSLLSSLFVENQISVGASGALFGLLGASISDLIINWSIYANKCLALWSLVLIVAINLAFGLMPHVDNFAHIGGFVGGLLLGFVFLMKPQYGWMNLRDPRGEQPVRKYSTVQYVLFIVSLALVLALYTAAIIALFKDVDANKRCKWCHYLSCVPTSRWKCDGSS